VDDSLPGVFMGPLSLSKDNAALQQYSEFARLPHYSRAAK
jgi:hypothetical protein